ncbi:MAG: T9SS type A sorting domain-containing protein [bacterium]
MSKVKTVLGMVLIISTGVSVQADRNAPGVVRPDGVPAFTAVRSSERAVPLRVVNARDALPVQVEPPVLPPAGEPPQILEMSDEGTPGEPRPLWGNDLLVYGGALKGPTPPGSERMIAYDQTRTGTLFAAFVVSNGDTVRIYRSTDGGSTWNNWNGVVHSGYILSSPELVVAEGESSFVFLFVRTSANNGDVYCARFGLTGGAAIFPVKADADTIVNLAACRDNASQYNLYVTYEFHNGYYNVRLLRSTDYGQTWTAPSSFVEDTRVPPKPDVAVGYQNRVYVSYLDKRLSSVDSAAFRVKRSTDRGQTWEQSRQVGTPIVRVFDGVIGADNTDPTVWLVHVRDLERVNGKGLGVFYYYTMNDDTSWYYGGDDGIGHGDTDNDEQMPSIATNWQTGTPTVAYAIVPSESLMFTWCSGDTNWARPIKVNDYRHTGNFAPAAGWKEAGGASYSAVLYAGVGPLNLWFDSWDNTTGVEERTVARSGAQVIVRPNPAERIAVISWSKPMAGAAELVIHDIAGRQVARLGGVNEVVWNCSRVPAGVYLYRLQLNGRSETGTIVVAH